MLLEALPAGSQARSGRRPARHRVRPARRHPLRRAILRPAVLSVVAAAAVIVVAVLVTGDFAGPLRDIAHMASPSAGASFPKGSTGHSAAPRVETTSAGLEPTAPPSATHSTASAQSVLSNSCQAFYSYYKHPEGLSYWATQLSLWDQLTKLTGTDDWFKVYQYCAPYVKGLFPGVPAAGQGQAPRRLCTPDRETGTAVTSGSRPAPPRTAGTARAVAQSAAARPATATASNGPASNGPGDPPGSGSNP